MKMRITQLIGLFLIICSANAFGQSNEDAKKAIKRLSAKLQSYTSIQANFTFTLYNEAADVTDSQDGKLLIRGDHYRLSMMGILALCNGSTLWSVSEEMKEVSVMDPDENDLFNPQGIFTLVDTDFNYSFVSQTTDLITVDLLPKDVASPYSKIRMVIKRASDEIAKVTYFSVDENQYIIVIKSLVVNAPVDDRFFSFDAASFPGFKLYDLR